MERRLVRSFGARGDAALAVALVTGVAFFLRLAAVESRPLWLDELGQITVAKESVPDMLHSVRTMAANAPLDFFGTRLAIGIAPGYEYAGRLWPLMVGTATIPILYMTVRAWVHPRAAMLASGLLALLPFHIYYSTEARPYALAILATTLMLWAYRTRRWPTLSMATLVGLLTFYPIAMTGAAMVIALLIRREWRGVMAVALAAAVIIPWLVYATNRPDGITWDRATPDLLTATVIVLGGQLGALAVIVLPAVAVGTRRHRHELDWQMLAALTAVSIPLTWIFASVTSYWWNPRHVAPLLPALLVLAAGALGHAKVSNSGHAPERAES